MHSIKTFWSKFASKSKLFFSFGLKKQSNQKVETLSYSIVEKRSSFFKSFGLILPLILIITFFTIIPFFINFKYAFFKEVQDPATKQLHLEFTLQFFEKLLNDTPNFAVGFRNSLIYGLLTLPFVISLSLLISSLIATFYRKWAKGIWQTIFFLPYMTNTVAVSLTFATFFSSTGGFNQFLDSAFGIKATDWLMTSDRYSFRPILPIMSLGIWNSFAFNVLIFTTAMLSVDKNLYKSASIDGIGGVKQFFQITLPSIKSTISFIVTFAIIGGIKVFPLALYDNQVGDALQNGAATLMLFIYQGASGSGGTDATALSACASILLLIIGVTYSKLLKGSLFAVGLMAKNLGEYRVSNKIKMTK